MRKNCVTCKHDSLRTPICDECYNTSDAPTKWEAAEYYEPDTNAERIRAMSDEELADRLADNLECYCCPIEYCDGCTKERCRKMLLEWLKQPAEEE